MSVWIDSKRWKDDWIEIEKLGSGGQGDVLKVKRKTDGLLACLKVLSKQSDPERRARFFREATAYQTCRHELVPRLVASNADHEDDLEYRIFIVSELIDGSTLEAFVNEKGPLSFVDAVTLTTAILGTLQYLHDEGWVHRDIKPDNIILRGSRVEAPVLLDFGLSFRDGVSKSFATELGQEVGNRFLRLPELGIGSSNKQDPRSDLAFAGGVLFYALTGQQPAHLQDSALLMPHQRAGCTEAIARSAGPAAMALMAWFDRALNPNLQRRHASSADMSKDLEQVLDSFFRTAPPEEADLEFVLAYVGRESTKAQSEMHAACEAAMRAIQEAQASLGSKVRETFHTLQTGYERTERGLRNSLGFQVAVKPALKFSVRFEIDVVGGDIVVQADGNSVHRTELLSPRFGEAFQQVIERIFAAGIRGLVEDPAAVVARGRYFISNPYVTLSDAEVQGAALSRPLFIVVFDDAHKSLSKLEHTLGYFMEYQATKELVEDNFVAAVVKASVGRDAGLVPVEDALEVPQWIVKAPNGNILVNEALYANPDEGLARVKAAIDKFTLREGGASS